jgi:hypothetical protein
MNHLVKLITNEDGDPCPPLWHLAGCVGGSNAVLCTGEVYGEGEGAAVTETKSVKRGGITCNACISQIREIKSVRL